MAHEDLRPSWGSGDQSPPTNENQTTPRRRDCQASRCQHVNSEPMPTASRCQCQCEPMPMGVPAAGGRGVDGQSTRTPAPGPPSPCSSAGPRNPARRARAYWSQCDCPERGVHRPRRAASALESRALGATRADVMRMVLLNACALVVSGLIRGGLRAWYLSSAARTFLFSIEATDPRAFAASIRW